MTNKDPNEKLKQELKEIETDIKTINEKNRLKKEIRKAKFKRKLIKLGLKKGENGE